jgi:hypothetical protein
LPGQTGRAALRSAYDHVDLTAAALGADQPLSPIRHGGFGAAPLGHFGRVGLNLMRAILAPDNQPDAGGGSIAERHRRAGLGFHLSRILLYRVREPLPPPKVYSPPPGTLVSPTKLV